MIEKHRQVKSVTFRGSKYVDYMDGLGLGSCEFPSTEIRPKGGAHFVKKLSHL